MRIAASDRRLYGRLLGRSAARWRSRRSGFGGRYPARREAMARAFAAGIYTMHEIADQFGVHYSTVSRAVRRLDADSDRGT